MDRRRPQRTHRGGTRRPRPLREPLGRIEHFRDPQKRFTFRSRLPNAADADAITKALLAYAAAFANLGDMKPDDE